MRQAHQPEEVPDATNAMQVLTPSLALAGDDDDEDEDEQSVAEVCLSKDPWPKHCRLRAVAVPEYQPELPSYFRC